MESGGLGVNTQGQAALSTPMHKPGDPEGLGAPAPGPQSDLRHHCAGSLPGFQLPEAQDVGQRKLCTLLPRIGQCSPGLLRGSRCCLCLGILLHAT